ncbi:MAG: hypothetical protein ACE5EV_08100, partial [Gaiellales bacterium]
LARLSEEKGMEALQAVNRRALELQKCDAGSALANHRVNFGIYFFDAEVADPTDEESDEA